MKRKEFTVIGLLWRSPLSSGSVQVDATVNVDGDGGEARRQRSSSSRGAREEEDGAREENEKADACLFIRKDVNRRARKSRRAE